MRCALCFVMFVCLCVIECVMSHGVFFAFLLDVCVCWCLMCLCGAFVIYCVMLYVPGVCM